MRLREDGAYETDVGTWSGTRQVSSKFTLRVESPHVDRARVIVECFIIENDAAHVPVGKCTERSKGA